MVDFKRLQCPSMSSGILVGGFPLERPEVALGWQFHQGCQGSVLVGTAFFKFSSSS